MLEPHCPAGHSHHSRSCSAPLPRAPPQPWAGVGGTSMCPGELGLLQPPPHCCPRAFPGLAGLAVLTTGWESNREPFGGAEGEGGGVCPAG